MIHSRVKMKEREPRAASPNSQIVEMQFLSAQLPHRTALLHCNILLAF